ncbi:MAG: WecB/TagA/CpsF family glycosyltransferase [Anaerolineaceae bacterium]|nr:WecB/TagA/CpsF family glycosyltransferase [Anaerolineaceae bacterium]
MNEYSKYEKMRDAGASPKEVYLAAKADKFKYAELIKLLRRVFDLSLVQAKEITVVSEGWADSLEKYQERFIPTLETSLDMLSIELELKKLNIRNILVVELADIGDLIVSTPALAALREARPDAHITLLTTSHSAPVIAGTNLVDEIITFDKKQFNGSRAFFQPANLRRVFELRKGHYDAVVFFHHFTLKLGTLKFALIALASGAKQRIGIDNGNGWFLNHRLPDGGFGAKHQAQYWLDLVSLLGASSEPHQAVVATQTFSGLPELSNQYPALSTIVIHPGSGGYSLARRWDAAKFATLADTLHQKYNAQIILVGGENDEGDAVKAAMKTAPVDLMGKTTLAELAGIIQAADLYIGADSGIMHLAASVGTAMVAIFGPSNADAWSPWTPTSKSIVVRSAPECSPCSYVGHSIGLREGCPARTCMRMVTVDHVLAAVEQILTHDFTGTRQFIPKLTAQSNAYLEQQNKRWANTIRILGLPVDAITYPQWLDLIGEWIATNQIHHVCTINPEFIMIARKDINFHNILSRADLCVPDGVGLLWAARHLGKLLPERVTGSDGVPKIAERAAQNGWKLYFLGAAPGVADQAANVLCQQHPSLQIVGIYSGSPAPEEEDSIVEKVNASGADILFVAYGAPEQDKWIARNLPRLQVKMAMGVGGAFDFIAGVIPRAPLWMRRYGIEWLYRLYLQPWRIRRMLRLPRFVLVVLLKGKHG